MPQLVSAPAAATTAAARASAATALIAGREAAGVGAAARLIAHERVGAGFDAYWHDDARQHFRHVGLHVAGDELGECAVGNSRADGYRLELFRRRIPRPKRPGIGRTIEGREQVIDFVLAAIGQRHERPFDFIRRGIGVLSASASSAAAPAAVAAARPAVLLLQLRHLLRRRAGAGTESAASAVPILTILPLAVLSLTGLSRLSGL